MKRDGRVFVITEEQADVIKKTSKMTHYRFVNNIGKFLESLLQDPVHATPCDNLTINGLDKSLLLSELVKRGIVKRDSRIEDKSSESPLFKVKYTVPKEGFVKKLNMFYMDMFGENIDITKAPINEDGEGGGAVSGGEAGISGGESTGGGATSCSTIDGGGSGPYYVMPLFGLVRRGGFYNDMKKKKKKKDGGKRD